MWRFLIAKNDREKQMAKMQMTKSERDGLLAAGTAAVIVGLLWWIGVMLEKQCQASHQEPEHTNTASVHYGQTYQSKKLYDNSQFLTEYSHFKKQLLKKYEQKIR